MVISPPVNGMIYVILTDDEMIPENMNSVKTVIFRQGASTRHRAVLIKPQGTLADPSLVRKPFEETNVCTYSGDGNPLHKHVDGWYYFDETWVYENGPFTSEEDAYESLHAYCDDLLKAKEIVKKDLTVEEFVGIMLEDEKVIGQIQDETIVEVEDEQVDQSGDNNDGSGS
jgi:hypothetical protein